MTLSGWIFMLTSWTVILSLFFYCMYRILRQEDNDMITTDEQPDQEKDF